MTYRSAAAYTDESVRTWRRRVESGEITAYRVGDGLRREVRLLKSDIDQYMQRHRIEPAEQATTLKSMLAAISKRVLAQKKAG